MQPGGALAAAAGGGGGRSGSSWGRCERTIWRSVRRSWQRWRLQGRREKGLEQAGLCGAVIGASPAAPASQECCDAAGR